MTSRTLPPTADAGARVKSARVPATARAALALLPRLQAGTLIVHTPDGATHHASGATRPELHATLNVHDWSVFAATMRTGDIGFAEGFMAGQWTTPQLADLLRLLLANRDVIEKAIYGSWWGRLLHRVQHALNRNTRRGSRRNISAHYDLGNDFYTLWLDETMNYSSAWFDGDHAQPLAQAQLAKLQRAIDATGVKPGERLLEIGCGWGAVAETAAREGIAVVGLTLSTEQLAWAQARVTRAGVAQHADLRLQDYRDVPDGPFDAIVSIEMFEAVGREYWDSYFQTVHAQLKRGGKACVQAIVIRDDLFERYVSSADFIQRYVFPGGMLASTALFVQHAQAAGLRVVERFAFGADYAETLRRWRHAFLARLDDVRRQGFDERFIRLWEFYLAYCEAAFDAGNTDVVQFTLQRD
ncbi:MAG: cyclopropane-fatty-acyl-phospholipid synthase family protein [Burkholderiaceae bacterium]|jgi:cyclopropane-fatty-acyl-phospholipid synthase